MVVVYVMFLFLLECLDGFAGNGVFCGVDVDMDGHPLESLECSDGSNNECRADNCETVPNSGQEDADNDRIGDECDHDDDNDSIKDWEVHQTNFEDNTPLKMVRWDEKLRRA